MKKPTLDLRPEHLAIVKAILRIHAPLCTVWAFGSRVTGTAKPTSDLDLAIQSPDKSLDMTIIGSLTEAFDESALPMKVDVVDYGRISPSFRTMIEEKRVPINRPKTIKATNR